MPFIDMDKRPLKEIFKGVSIKTAYGERLMMSFVHFQPNSLVPEHSHPHEQMGMVTKGRFELVIAGESRIVKEGEVYLIPSNVKHSAKGLDRAAIALDIFNPPREEYK